MKYALSWYQVNYTKTGRIVRANVVTEIEGHGVIGSDVTLNIPLDAPISDALILEALSNEVGGQDIQPVPVEVIAEPAETAAE